MLPASTVIGGEAVQYGHLVLVNSTGYMQITNYSPEFVSRHPAAYPSDEVPYDHYNIPYRFAESLDQVLVVGAGAGNDIAAALRNGAQRVTAVEIDPGVIQIGRQLHPEAPYSDPRVVVVNDDARSFFKRTQERYDLIVFGLLDSHTLSSSYANVRLDNYVYTTESFVEAKHLLKPDGVLVLIFEIDGSDDFIGIRIERMLTEVFGRPPLDFSVRSHFRGWGGTGLVAGNPDTLAQRLASDAGLQRIVGESRTFRDRWTGSTVDPATDDWPYLYLKDRAIPSSYFIMFAILLLFSVAGVRVAYGGQQRMNWLFFFLGAGFMLLEVQNVSKLALVFGTTWTVNTIVLSAILTMMLLANYYVMRVRIVSLCPFYAALFITLLVNFLLPLGAFAMLPVGLKEALIGLVLGLPIFFASIIFSTLFAIAENRATALASNLLGAMAGGMLESLTFLVGIKGLLIVTGILYLCHIVIRRRPLRSLILTVPQHRKT